MNSVFFLTLGSRHARRVFFPTKQSRASWEGDCVATCARNDGTSWLDVNSVFFLTPRPRHCEEGGLPDEAISWPWCGIASQRALAMTEQVVDI